MYVYLPILFLAAGMMLLLGYSHRLFRENRTRVVREPVFALPVRRAKPVAVEPELIWRTLVAGPVGSARR